MSVTSIITLRFSTARYFGLPTAALILMVWTLGRLEATAAAEPPAGPGAAAAANKVQDVKFLTKDGVNIVATYYPSSKGKEAVPVILLHGFKGNRGEFKDLALYLQSIGCAVLAPDLRGHGGSTKQEGNPKDLNPDLFRRPDPFKRMYTKDGGDLEKCKDFLLGKNNDGELNIDKLCVIGAQMGASVALNWAVTDWSWPVLLSGKQGQDVKALVLVSPEMSSKGGMTPMAAINHPDVCSKLSILIIVGNKSPKAKDAETIHKFFKAHHETPPPEKAKTDQDLFLYTCDTNLQGTSLLAQPALKLNAVIGEFITARLIDKAAPWRARKS